MFALTLTVHDHWSVAILVSGILQSATAHFGDNPNFSVQNYLPKEKGREPPLTPTTALKTKSASRIQLSPDWIRTTIAETIKSGETTQRAGPDPTVTAIFFGRDENGREITSLDRQLPLISKCFRYFSSETKL